MSDFLSKTKDSASRLCTKIKFISAYVISICFPLLANHTELMLKPIITERLPSYIVNDSAIYMTIYGLMGLGATSCIKWIGISQAKIETEQNKEIVKLKRRVRDLHNEQKEKHSTMVRNHTSEIEKLRSEIKENKSEHAEKIAELKKSHEDEISRYQTLIKLHENLINNAKGQKDFDDQELNIQRNSRRKIFIG